MAAHEPPPVTPASGPTRRRGITNSASIPALLNSPITTRSGKPLGNVGTKSGPGFSPYARRTLPRSATAANGFHQGSSSPSQELDPEANTASAPSGGLVSLVKGLPGKAIGFLWRGGSARKGGLTESQRSVSLADLQSEARIEATGARRGKGLPRASSVANALSLQGSLSNSAAVGPPPRSKLSSSMSMSSLPPPLSLRKPIPSFTNSRRTSHSTLVIPEDSSNPLFPSRSRHASPALSSASLTGSYRRSPSPVRASLAGSTSAFNLSSQASGPSSSYPNHQPLPSPSASATIFAARPTSNAYGLKSRSPFLGRSPSTFSRLGSPSARSVSSSTHTPKGGHALFPYTSSIPRGRSSVNLHLDAQGSGPSSGQKRSYSYSDAGGATSPRAGGFARMGSPLNPGFGGSAYGDERARKKQLVWDPVKGLVSRELLDKEAERERESVPLPKNEAERILEVLEGMGRTPMGEAKRGGVLKPKISVPTPTAPTSYPYSRRTGVTSQTQRPGTGLSSVFRAREERRQAEREQERERRDEEERQVRREEDDEFDMEVLRDEEEQRKKEYSPRRKTRSMGKVAPSPAKEKDSAKGKEKATTKAKPKAKGRTRRETSEAIENDADDLEQSRRSAPASRAKSPPPRVRSPPPRFEPPAPPSPPAPAEPKVAPVAHTESAPAPVQQPKAAASSLRPGRSHSTRTHVTSSKVFSAREEDLPPVDEGELNKIKMPLFPANFSFETAPAPPPTQPPAKVAPLAAAPSDLFSRMGPPASAPPSTAMSKPAFSFASAPAATTAAAPPKPTAAPDFFATSTVVPPPAVNFSSKPNFFASVIDKAGPTAPPTVTPLPPTFSFGSAPSIKPTEVVTPKEESAPVANPFSFGKPAETKAPAPASNFFGNSNGGSGSMFGPQDPKPNGSSSAPAANPFGSFGKPISEVVEENKTPALPTSNLFANLNGASGSLFGPQEPKPNGVSSIFGKVDTAPSPFGTASPFGGFGISNSPSPFGKPAALAPPAIAVQEAPKIEDTADEDSGMEDETVPAHSFHHSAPPPAVSFPSFASPSPSPAQQSPAVPIFGFGAPTSAPAFNFGTPSTSSVFPSAAANGFPSPAATGFPASAAASPFSFGTTAAPGPVSPFAFAAPSNGTPASSFSFGGAGSAAPSPFGAVGGGDSPFAFGSGAPASLPGSPALFTLGSGGEDSPDKRVIKPMRRRRP